MARQPGLRKKDGQWASDAGGKTRYYGRVGEVSHEDALRGLHAFLGRPSQGIEIPVAVTLSVDALADKFLAWVLGHRGLKAHQERSRHLGRFRDTYGELLAAYIQGRHLEEFIEGLRVEKHAPDYIAKHVISVKAMYHQAVKKGWLPPSVRPFEGVEPVRLTPKALTEDKLPTDDEVRKLFAAADADAHGQMGDIVRLYHATGARTGELIAVRAGDFQRSTRQIILAKHKRSHTLRQPVPRVMTLNEVAFEIMARRTGGQGPDAIVFPRTSDGKAYTNLTIAERFQNVRKRSKIRDDVTIYSFRHLWISEMLMAGIDVLMVARMAGTGVKMIENVYGHYRTQSYQDAQARLDEVRRKRSSTS